MFAGWKVVLGAGFGIAIGSAVFVSSAFALLGAAMGAQFGWDQSQIALGASITLLLQVFSYPLVGMLADRIGSRRAAMIAMVGFIGTLVMLSQVGSISNEYLKTPLEQFYAAFFLMGIFAAGTNVVSYAPAITNWFDRKRGLALGIAAAFQAVGATIMPLAIHQIIVIGGWPSALLALAGFILLVSLPLVSALVKDSPAPFGLFPDGDVEARSPEIAATTRSRVSLSELVADSNFRLLALAFFVMGFAAYALTTNIAYILQTISHFTIEQVALIQAVTGASVLIGRVGFGWLLDNFHPPGVAVVAILLGSGVFVSYGDGVTFQTAIFTAIAAGIAIGGESDLMPYLSGRYFNKDSVSTVFGWFLSVFALGASLGPVTVAKASAYFGGPTLPLLGIAVLHSVALVAFLSLKRPKENAQVI